MGSLRKTRKLIAAEAVDWFLHFQDRTRGEPNRQAFSEWLLRSPSHVDEYLRVACTWRKLDVGDQGNLETAALVAAARKEHETDNVVPLRGRLNRGARTAGGNPREQLPGRTRAAALAACVLLGVSLWIAYPIWRPAMTSQTAIGEQRSFTLQDGSVVFLNTNSKVSVRWSSAERHVDLLRGEARFKVAKDPSRPFIVATTKAAVRAVGTIFNVRAEASSTQVAVLEGQVEVVAATRAPETEPLTQGQDERAMVPGLSSSMRLAAGQRAAVTSLGIEANAGPPLESVMAWTERRLVFRDQPLSAVLSEFNRYQIQPLLLDDPELATLKISGIFDLNDPESLIAYLGAYETVQVDRKSDGSQHLFRAAPVYPKK